MIKHRIIALIDKNRVRTFAILALLILMAVLYGYQHHEVSSRLPLPTVQFHYPLTHEATATTAVIMQNS